MSDLKDGASEPTPVASSDGSSRLKRIIWTAGGTVFLALGLIGIALPVLPTTPFLLLAAACYLKGSRRMYEWLTNNKLFGRYLTDYMEGRGIPLRAKAATLCMLWAAIAASILFVIESLILRIVLLAIAAGVTIHIIMIRTKRRMR
ncbi:MAG: YbaN family protein [Methanobacteriota archaeon]|nr:MAG: YbaN family protein [Euryarchaeota archaeon]